MDVAQPAVSTVRAFNRGYTKVIGVLDEGLLHSPYTLTEVRVLFEIAHTASGADGAPVARIREDLSLDAGYLSRILARFEVEGLVVKSRAADDARKAAVALTEKGRALFASLDGRSNDQIRELLDRLSPADRRRLVEAMTEISTLLGLAPSPAAEVSLRSPRPGDFGWVIERHGTLYAQERAWDISFEALVAEIVADFARSHDPDREAFWIAEARGRRVGCIACVDAHADDVPTAKLRLLLVDPAARGLGVGARLVEECIGFARKAGYRRIVLYTVAGLDSARRIYEAVGFRLVGEEAVHKYGHDLVDQNWALDLD